MKPWRKVIDPGHLRRCNSIGNNQLQSTWWDLELECGHSVERRPRYPKQTGSYVRGFAALHHPRNRDEAKPAPQKVRCEYCEDLT